MRAISSLSPPKASAFVFYSLAFEPVAAASLERVAVVNLAFRSFRRSKSVSPRRSLRVGASKQNAVFNIITEKTLEVYFF
jgi:hypothetical protein